MLARSVRTMAARPALCESARPAAADAVMKTRRDRPESVVSSATSGVGCAVMLRLHFGCRVEFCAPRNVISRAVPLYPRYVNWRNLSKVALELEAFENLRAGAIGGWRKHHDCHLQAARCAAGPGRAMPLGSTRID